VIGRVCLFVGYRWFVSTFGQWVRSDLSQINMAAYSTNM